MTWVMVRLNVLVDLRLGMYKLTAATTRLRKNVCYIAGGLAVREDKILLIQEGMPSCRGTWYLPCGRVDPNETIEVR